METDDGGAPKKRKRVSAAEKAFSDVPSFKLRWVGFVNTVAACLVTRKGAIIPCIGVAPGGSGVKLWHFYVLTADAPNSTLQFTAMPSMFPTMLEPLHELAVPSDRYTRQLLLNFLGETGLVSHARCEVLLACSAPYFLCDTQEEAFVQLSDWLDSEQGMRLTGMVKDVPDYGPPEQPELVPAEEPGDEFVCVICMDRTPTTCVQPCGHVVACSTCSIGLRDTADKRRCVRCRTLITSVEDLKTGTVTLV